MKVLITNAANDTGLVAARSLARAGFRVIGADFLRLSSWGRSRYVSQCHQLAGADERQCDDALVNLVETVQPDVFLPLGTRGTRAAARRRDQLSAKTAVNVVDEKSFMAAFDKVRCMAECKRLGIPCAEVLSFEQAMAKLERAPGQTTLVVKPTWDAGGASGVRYVRDPEALREMVERCSKKYGGALIQDFIPGDAGAMRTVLLLFTPQSELAAAFTMQKIRHWPQTGGPTAVARSTYEPALIEQVLPFFRAWNWHGPAEVELKLDPRDGRCKVIEINPRFPGYLRFPVHCGLDLPLIAVRAALGNQPAAPPPAYQTEQRYVAPALFARTVRDDIRVHGMGAALRRAGADLHCSAPMIWGMLDDPLPVLSRILHPPARRRTRLAYDALILE